MKKILFSFLAAVLLNPPVSTAETWIIRPYVEAAYYRELNFFPQAGPKFRNQVVRLDAGFNFSNTTNLEFDLEHTHESDPATNNNDRGAAVDGLGLNVRYYFK